MHLFWVLLLFPGSLHQKILEFAITLLIISLNQENFTAAGSNDFFFLNQKKKKPKQTNGKKGLYIPFTNYIHNTYFRDKSGMRYAKWFKKNQNIGLVSKK